MNTTKHIIYLFILISCCSTAQTGRLYTSDSDLSSSLVNCLHQDSRGYIWTATEEGLNRYDGAKFVIYKTNTKNSESPSSNYIKTIFEDKDNNLFIGFLNGLQLYKHDSETFTTIDMLGVKGEKLFPHITSIIQLQDGQILISTSGFGIFKLKQENGKFTAFSYNLNLPAYTIQKLYEDKHQNLWIASRNNGLYKIDKNKKTTQYFNEKEHPVNLIDICEDGYGNLYIGTLNKGLFIFNDKLLQFTSVENSKNLPIKELYFSKNKTILIGTDGMGLYAYNPTDKTLKFKEINISNFDFSFAKVHSILEDNYGNLWLGLFQKGVFLLPAIENKFNYIGYQSNTTNIIGSNSVMTVFAGKNDILWIGTDGDGLYGISKKTHKKFHYNLNTKSSARLTVMCVFEDSNQDIWVGTYLHGLAKVNKQTQKLDFITNLVDQDNKTVENIFSIVEDKDKRLWIGSMGSGLLSLDLKTQKVQDIRSMTWLKNNNLINKYINCLMISHDNSLYIGTYDGLFQIPLQTKINRESATLKFLDKTVIYAITEDKYQSLWIGTNNGLVRQNVKTKQNTIFTTENNLPSNTICGIKSDAFNNIWISTNSGISKYDSAHSKFYNYRFKDGLQGNEFNKNASTIDTNGNIIFGGMKGVTYFNPSLISKSKKRSNVYITGFYLQDKSVTKGTKSNDFEIINEALIDAKTVDLSYNDNSFSIEFSTMDFTDQKQITYYYSLNNSNWNRLQQGNNTITFNNLDPGKYQLKVKAEQDEKLSTVRELTIIIHPLWYLSFWAYAIYLVILVGCGYYIHLQFKQRRADRKRLQENLQQKEIAESKLQFLTNISHDIKAPITIVANSLAKVMTSTDQQAKIKWYKVMTRNTEKIIELVTQVMDVKSIVQGKIDLNYKQSDIIELITEVTLLFEDQLEAKEITLTFEQKEANIYAWIDPTYFERVIQNILSNAIKFVRSQGNIVINVKVLPKDLRQNATDSTLEITVKDDGIGIPEKELEYVFDRFYQAASANNSTLEGTGIGLHFSKTIVELHNGSIMVENNLNTTGCLFTINVPLGLANLNMTANTSTNPQSQIAISTGIDSNNQNKTPEITTSIVSKKRILVIDDNAELRDYICDAFAKEYKVFTSSNGIEALEIAMREPIDLIISDIKMPKMDGITFCRRVKRNSDINQIPIILLTAQSSDEDLIEGLNNGADAYITKPFTMEILSKTVQNIIRNRAILKLNYSGNQKYDIKIEDNNLESSDEKLIQKVINFINKNISNPDLNVELIATEIGISRVHLHRKLKELTNQSSRDLIRNIRLKQAGELLSGKNRNISEVAYMVGFTNTSKFSTSFKQFYGKSPKAYMETYKDNNHQKLPETITPSIKTTNN